MLLVLDNYDSFTFNLVQYLGELAAEHPIAAELRVERNDALSLDQIRALAPDAILISPGPGDPDQAGVCLEVLRELGPELPILGVCLGHQCLAQVFGGRVVRAAELMHGKTSPVLHAGQGVFADLPNPLTATRYHSLIAERSSLPACLEVTAWLEDGTIMGLRHRDHPNLQGCSSTRKACSPRRATSCWPTSCARRPPPPRRWYPPWADPTQIVGP
jgi:para-aminobenzoate synthetase component 2